MLANSYRPLITHPTRIHADSCASLIDNIFINTLEYENVSGNLIDSVSDHLPNFTFLANGNVMKGSLVRDCRSFNSKEYIEDFNNLDLDSYINDVNALDKKYEEFQSKVLNLINKHAPLKFKTKRQRKQLLKPWITNGILKSIHNKNKLYKNYLKTKDDFWYQRYKKHRTMLNHVIRLSKRQYHLSYFEKLKHDYEQVCKGINNLLRRNKSKHSQDIKLNINGRLISDPKSVANACNNFFTSVAQNLVNKLSPSNTHFKNYLNDPNSDSFFVTPVTPSEVNRQLLNLNEGKAPDAYNIPVKLIKCVSDALTTPLTKLINESFESGFYPNMLKYAKVVPIHKAKSTEELTNYRPVSLLPIFNKILEKLMHTRLISFLEKHNIIFEHPFGFQKKKSTSLAILDLYNQLVRAIEHKHFSCCIFLDLAKAFDTVDNSILLDKLEYYGIRGTALNWFKSYLTDRAQKVSINGQLSNSNKIKSGVPQGSVLGPLLFLLYINDMPSVSKLLKFHLFADDTSIFFSDQNLRNLENTVNHELTKVSDWLTANKLTLNVEKSNFLLISSSQHNLSYQVNLSIDDKSIVQKDCIKYLGVIIDKNLN